MEEAPELEQLTLRFYEAIGRGDAGLVRELTSSQRGVLGIGSEPNEWWEGAGPIAAHVKAQLDALGGELNVVHGAPSAYREGSVGWISDGAAALRLENGTEVPFRFTAVFHQEDGDWKMVQFHTSVGVLNESAMGEALPS